MNFHDGKMISPFCTAIRQAMMYKRNLRPHLNSKDFLGKTLESTEVAFRSFLKI